MKWTPRVKLDSIRAQLMSLLGTTFLVITLIVFFGIIAFIYNLETNSWLNRQNEITRSAANVIDSFLQKDYLFLEWLSQTGTDEMDQDLSLVRKILDTTTSFQEIVLTDSKGKILSGVSSDQRVLMDMVTIPQSVWFQRASRGEAYYSPVQIAEDGKPYMVLAIPLSENRGVLAARSSLDRLWQEVHEIHFGRSGYAFVINQDGRVIAHPDIEVVLRMTNLEYSPGMAPILSAPNHEWSGKTYDSRGKQVVVSSQQIGQSGWIIVTEMPYTETHWVTTQTAAIIGGSLLLVMALATFFVRYLLVRDFLNAVTSLREGAGRIGQGDLSFRFSHPPRNELGLVMTTFNQMAEQLEKNNQQMLEVNEELEHRVRERTQALLVANTLLHQEVNERTQAEEQIRESLKEKEVLLREIHHRVKNNLQVVSSLLNLQSGMIKDEQVSQALLESRSRIFSMTLIHEKLYQTNNFSSIDMRDYLQSLVAAILRLLPSSSRQIAVTYAIDPIHLSMDLVVPCGLIVNELVMNAAKYAFPEGSAGNLNVEMRLNESRTAVQLRVADDGVGLPKDFSIEQSKSLGMKLVNSLVNQIEGSLQMISENGTVFLISFPYSDPGDSA